jgi:hypothetical protein
MNKIIYLISLFFCWSKISSAQVWQWSVEFDGIVSKETNAAPTAFLWVPENCRHVRGAVVGQHNMLEEGILEHAVFRKKLTDIGFAEVWVTPSFDMVFNFNKGAGEHFDNMLKKLGQVSGYTELEFAPIVPIGHSAAASYPWNFGAWAPQRTLAILSVHGDAPLTNLTGSGQPNPDWGNRHLDGIPGLMVMGEYEWWEKRLEPALEYRMEHQLTPISFLADAGRGHFDYSDGLVEYLALFIKKSAEKRLPKKMPRNKPAILNPVDPSFGWLGDRWHKDSLPNAKAAPFKKYKGNIQEAFWYFDKEMADATEQYYAVARGKKPQYIGYFQNDTLLAFNPKLHARINATFTPHQDGLTFNIAAVYTDTMRSRFEPIHGSSKINISRICGPVVKLDDTTFSVRFYRMGFNNPRRSGDIWLMASSDGDAEYKSSVQQLNIRIPLLNEQGAVQHISFPQLKNIKIGTEFIALNAASDSGLPVYYFVKKGPAEVVDNKLRFTSIPPRSKFPVKVTVVAWQYGISTGNKIQSAEPVSRSFYIGK